MLMGIFLTYILQVAVIMNILCLVYKWLISDTTFFALNRGMLMLIYAFSWLLPLFLNINWQVETVSEIEVDFGQLEVVGIASPAPASDYSGYIRASMWVYLAGVVITGLWVIVGVIRLSAIVKAGVFSKKIGRFTELICAKAPGPFSWWKYIVLRPQDMGENYDMIVTHELAHLKLRHGFDLILAQLSLIFQWFSPASWILMRSIKENHEYQVDKIASGADPYRYQMMLIKMTAGTRLPLLADSLNHSKLKKRLTMMMTKKTSSSRRFATMALPAVAAVAFVALSQPSVARIADMVSSTSILPLSSVATDKVSNSYSSVQMAESAVDVAAPSQSVDENTPVDSKNADMTPSVATDSGAEDTPVARDNTSEKAEKAKPAIFIDGVLYKGDLNSISSDDVASMVVVKNDPEYPQGKIMVKTKNSNWNIPNANNESQTYLVTNEKIAEYKGGQAELMSFLAKNIKCPENLEKMQRVIVQFTIEQDGTVNNARIVRGGDDACNEEALKVVNMTSGNWIPGQNDGKPVATQFTLPINFKPEVSE